MRGPPLSGSLHVNLRRLATAVLAVSAFGVGAAALLLALRREPVRVPVENLDVALPPPPPSAPREKGQFDDVTGGGTFAGVVVDERDRPVRDADVLLVAIDEDAKVVLETIDADEVADKMEFPVFGEYRTAARGRTDAEGRFALAAGSARVVAIVAWERAFAPAMKGHVKDVAPLKPGPGHVLRLARAGWLRGRVVDKETGKPVGGAEVLLYLQHPANQGGKAGPVPLSPSNLFSVFQRYVSRELGPKIWGYEPRQGDTGFPLFSTQDGWFTFGPLMREVQVEAVVTHPDYMWTDHDAEQQFDADAEHPLARSGVGRKVRVVVEPGETKEVVYALVKGKEIRGTVVDGDGQPLEGVGIELEHVAQYAQHWRYRTHPRTARTDAAGRFRVAGLSYGPYNLWMRHPTFEPEHFNQVQEGSDEVYKVMGVGGWVDLEVEGGPLDEQGRPKSWSGRALVEPSTSSGTRRHEAVLVSEGKAKVERLRPGRYTISLVSGTHLSTPAVVEVRRGEGTGASVRMEAGGGVRLEIRDTAGRVVDPAEVHLYLQGSDRERQRAAVLVAREGRAHSDGLLGGVYAAEVTALGFLPETVPSFTIPSGRPVVLPTVVMRRQSYLQVKDVVAEDGRAVAVDTAVYVGEDGEEPTRRFTKQAGLLPVKPGRVLVRAEATDGRRFEQQIEVPEGTTVPLVIRLAK